VGNLHITFVLSLFLDTILTCYFPHQTPVLPLFEWPVSKDVILICSDEIQSRHLPLSFPQILLESNGVSVSLFAPYLFVQLIRVINTDRLCGLVVRVRGYSRRGPGFDSTRFQIY
jgi:hypothetical protein